MRILWSISENEYTNRVEHSSIYLISIFTADANAIFDSLSLKFLLFTMIQKVYKPLTI